MSPSDRSGIENSPERDAPATTAGWFGKIPALGDFVTRRLPAAFVEPWDAWLSAELIDAQLALADAWQGAYRQAPIWRFALMPGAIDGKPWYGAWIPSRDRVGRQFPLTIALPGPLGADAVQRCWAAFVAAGRRALEPDCGADCIDAALREFAGEQDELPVLAAPAEGHIAAALCRAADGSSLWWPWLPEDPMGAATSTFQGLPRGEDFRKLLRAR